MIPRALLGLYLLAFFGFLLGPLLVMGVSAFNTPTYPQAWPIEGFTLDWFSQLFADENMMYGLRNSIIIGVLVSILSVLLGLSGALAMTQVYARARGLYYFVVVAPILTPGVLIGIATVIFWKDVTAWTGLKPLFTGFFLTVLAQSSFIGSYCLLIFLARLQRYDRGQEEAALDLGASRTQVFFDILLPYLRPAAFSAAVIAFLSSFENYNTTTFAILADKTLTTVLAGRVRQGMTPAISALAVLIVAVTIVAAGVYEIASRGERRAPAN